jgi:hypothetical protein
MQNPQKVSTPGIVKSCADKTIAGGFWMHFIVPPYTPKSFQAGVALIRAELRANHRKFNNLRKPPRAFLSPQHFISGIFGNFQDFRVDPSESGRLAWASARDSL